MCCEIRKRYLYVLNFQDAVGEDLKKKKYIRKKAETPSPTSTTTSPNSVASGLIHSAPLLFFHPSLACLASSFLVLQGLSTLTVPSSHPDEMETQIVPGPSCTLPDGPPPAYLAGIMAVIHANPPSVNPQLQLKPALKAMIDASSKNASSSPGGEQQRMSDYM